MQLILALPSLFDERSGMRPSSPAPALAQLIALAGNPERQSAGLDAALAARYGVERQSDWPLAPIRLAALGIEPADGYWLTADPVAIDVGLASAELAGIVDDLDRSEADALLRTLNGHFESDELAFVAPRPDRFFVRAATATRISTVPATAALRRPLRALLPQGADAGIWRRWQSEIEMLLHEHPVNVERERTKRAQVGSFWFSEGGTLVQPRRPGPGIATYSANGTASALAAFTGAPAHPLPAGLSQALAPAAAVDLLVVATGQALDVASVEQDWAIPARDALAAGSLSAVTLIADDAGSAVIWHARRPGWWQRIAGRLETHDLRALLDAAREAA